MTLQPLVFAVPVVKGYGFVIPRSPIAGINQFTIGFEAPLWVRRLRIGREFVSHCERMRAVAEMSGLERNLVC